MMTIAEQWVQEGRQKGRQEGRQEGRLALHLTPYASQKRDLSQIIPIISLNDGGLVSRLYSA